MSKQKLPEKLCNIAASMRIAAIKVEELERQLVEAQKDQARYLWLRNNTLVDGEINEELYVHVDSDKFPGQWALVEEDLDQAIDLAMQAK